MAATIDRMEFVRKLRGKLPSGWEDQHTEAVADALDEALKHARLATATGLELLESRLTIKGALGLVALGGFLTAIKYFG